jgi:hypothetical protein
MKTCALLFLVPLGLGCHSDNPRAAAAPAALHSGAEATGPVLTLRVAPDGSIQALDQIVYDPRLGDAAAFQAFLARRRVEDPDLAFDFLAEPGVSMSTLERAALLAGPAANDRSTFKIGGSVLATLRAH